MSGSAFTPRLRATCISCGCTDDQACSGGCSWVRVNYADGVGVCSSCPEAAADFDQHFATEATQAVPIAASDAA